MLRDDVQNFLQQHGIRLNTDLGQHFLVDEDALETIVESANIEPTDHIVEIGPGIGILTRELLDRAAQVTAIELDRRLIPLLQTFVTNNPFDLTQDRQKPITNNQFTIVQGNALQTPLPTQPYKIVANIPYHITSPLLRHVFLESPVTPQSMTLLIQREVAQKICDTAHAGMLTILVALFGTPHLIAKVSVSSFLPPPKVDSAILQIECFEKPLADPATIERIFTLTKHAFSGKRKMLRNTLGNLPEGAALMAKVGIEGTRRPETLTIEEWIALARPT